MNHPIPKILKKKRPRSCFWKTESTAFVASEYLKNYLTYLANGEGISWPTLNCEKSWIMFRESGLTKADHLGPPDKHYYSLRDEIFLNDDGVLCHQHTKTMVALTCVPSHLQCAVVRKAHQLCGHRGVEATIGRVLASAYFPSIKTKVKEVVRRCLPCQVKGGPPKPQKHTPASTVEGFPFQRISIDFVGPMKTSKKGNSYLLTVKDHLLQVGRSLSSSSSDC